MSSEDVKEGDSVTLSCSSRGRPDVSFSWFKKRIQIENSQQMSELKLSNVKPEDSGEYYCEAKNKLGANESNIIIIDVKCKFYANEEKTTRINHLFKSCFAILIIISCNHAFHVPSDGPKTVTVTEPQGSINDLKEGDTLTLKCSVKESNPPANQFTWYKNSQVLRHTSEILTIINVTADDRGSYHCKANNDIKAAESNEITVSVKCKYCYFHFTNNMFMFLMKYL